MFRQKVVAKNKTHTLRSITFFPENRTVYDNNMEKYRKA